MFYMMYGNVIIVSERLLLHSSALPTKKNNLSPSSLCNVPCSLCHPLSNANPIIPQAIIVGAPSAAATAGGARSGAAYAYRRGPADDWVFVTK